MSLTLLGVEGAGMWVVLTEKQKVCILVSFELQPSFIRNLGQSTR